MTLIIKSDTALSNPQGSRTIPGLNTDGLITRYHPLTLTADVGGVVGAWTDHVGGRNLSPSQGSALLGEDSGVRYVDLGANAGTNLLQSVDGVAGLTGQISVAMAVYLGSVPASALQLTTLRAGGSNGITLFTDGTIGAFAGPWPYPKSAAVPRPGWRVVVGVFDLAAATGKIAVDGVIVSGEQAQANTGSWRVSIRGTGAAPVRVADYAVFDHSLSDTEVTAVTNAMLSNLAPLA